MLNLVISEILFYLFSDLELGKLQVQLDHASRKLRQESRPGHLALYILQMYLLIPDSEVYVHTKITLTISTNFTLKPP